MYLLPVNRYFFKSCIYFIEPIQLVMRIIFITICLFIATLSASAQTRLPFAVPKDWTSLPERAIVDTTKGMFEIKFYRKQAPIHVRNFQYLADKNFYNNLSFHRFEPDFIIQGGDPLATGKGGPGYNLPPEFSEIKHDIGTVGMARLPGEVNPERLSNGSQFYICLTKAPHLDSLYTVFGEVVTGMDTVLRLRKGDRIISIRFP